MKGRMLGVALSLAGGGATADGCEGFLSDTFFQGQPDAATLACVAQEGVAARGSDGSTALHLAASYGDASLVRELLAQGADLSLLDRAGLSPLDAAAARSTDAAVAAALLAWGAPANPEDRLIRRDRATTPLMRAAGRPAAVDVVAVLLAAGADPLWQNATGETALHVALRDAGGGEVARLLLHHLAKADVADDAGTTPLHIAASYLSDPDLMRLLLADGAKVDAEGPDGVTPLMLAATYATDPDTFAVLLDSAAEPCKVDASGRTARVLAEVNPALRDTDPYWRLNQSCPAVP